MATAAAITSSSISSANSNTVSNTLHGTTTAGTSASSSNSAMSSSRSRRSTKQQQQHNSIASDSKSSHSSSSHGGSSSSSTTKITPTTNSSSTDSHKGNKTSSSSNSSSGQSSSKWKDNTCKTKGLKWNDEPARDRRKQWNNSSSSKSGGSSGPSPANLYKMKGLRWKAFVETNPISAELRSTSDEDDPERKNRCDIISPSNLYKMKGLRWQSFIEGNSIVSAMRLYNSDEEDGTDSSRETRTPRIRGTVMRLDRSDMGLYGLCPETDPFYAVVCGICSAVVKPQGLQKHMINRHHSSSHGSGGGGHHSHHQQQQHHHYHRHSNYASTSSAAAGHPSERSSAGDHYGTTAHERSDEKVASAASKSISNHGSPQTTSSKSKSKSTSKVKSKSAKSIGHSSSSSATPSPSASSSSSSSSSSSTSSSTSSSGAAAAAAITGEPPSSAMANGSSVGTLHGSAPSSRTVSNSVVTTQQSNHHKQIKPPLVGTACFSVLPTVSQHLQSSSSSSSSQQIGGSPAKGMVAPQHNESVISEAVAPTHSVTSSNSNSSISSISSTSSSSLLPRRTYGRSKSSCVERKNVPVKDREYDADRHCGVMSADSTRPCTRSLTCKAHSLSLRRMVSGRSKSFDKLLADHRASKDPSTTNSRAIPEFESSNSSSSMDLDRRSVHSVSSNSNLSVEVQASSTASSQSSASAYGPESGATKQSTPPPSTAAAVGNSTTIVAAAATNVSRCIETASSAPVSANISTGRSLSSRAAHLIGGPNIPGLIAETVETVRINERQNVQINITPDGNTELTSTQSSMVSATRRVNTARQRPRGNADHAVADDDEEPPQQARVRTRVIETDPSGIPAELLDDSKFATNIFSPESTVLKGPIRLLRDARLAKRPRIETDQDLDMSEMSEERKLQVMVQRKVTKKNEILFRDPTKPGASAITIPPAAQIVAEAFAEENPAATLTDAEFVMDPETSLVSVSVCGTFNPNNMQINWAPLNQHFFENTIATALSPYGIQVNPLPPPGQPLPAIAGPSAANLLLPDPADEGFQIHHLPPLTEEEYNQMRPEFLNGMPKPCMMGCPPGIKLEMKQEAEEENNARLAKVPPILPMLKPDEIKTERIKEESIDPLNQEDGGGIEQRDCQVLEEQRPVATRPQPAATTTPPPPPPCIADIQIPTVEELLEPVSQDWIESPSVSLAVEVLQPVNEHQIILPQVFSESAAIVLSPLSPEPLSLDMDEDFAIFEESDMGLIDPIPTTTTTTTAAKSSLSPTHEKENSNYNDDDHRQHHHNINHHHHNNNHHPQLQPQQQQQYHSSYSDDIVYRNGTGNVRNWYYGHQPRPYHVNQFGLVKLRGSTNFKKSILCTRRFKHIRPQRRLIALNSASNHALKRQSSSNNSSTGTQTTMNPFFKPYNTGSGPGNKIKLQKRSIIMHHRSNGQQQLSKTCKTLRSQIVNKLAEQLLGFKKVGGHNNNNNNNNNSIIINSNSNNNNSIHTKQISQISVNNSSSSSSSLKSATKLPTSSSHQQHNNYNLPPTTTTSSSSQSQSIMYRNSNNLSSSSSSKAIQPIIKVIQGGSQTTGGFTTQGLRKATATMNGTISHVPANSIIQRYSTTSSSSTANTAPIAIVSPLMTSLTGTISGGGGGSSITTTATNSAPLSNLQHRGGRNVIVHRQNMIASLQPSGFNGSVNKNCGGNGGTNCNQRNSGGGGGGGNSGN